MKYILIFITLLFLGCNQRKKNQKNSLINKYNLIILEKEVYNFSYNPEGCKRSYVIINTIFQNNTNDTILLDLNFVTSFCDFYDYPRIDISQVSYFSEVTVLSMKKTKTPLKILPMDKDTISLYINYNFIRTLKGMADDLNKLAENKTFFTLKTNFGTDTINLSLLNAIETNYYLDGIKVKPTDSISIHLYSSPPHR